MTINHDAEWYVARPVRSSLPVSPPFVLGVGHHMKWQLVHYFINLNAFFLVW